MSDDTRPEWKHELSEADVRWLSEGFIIKVTHHWEFTSEDTSRDWIELHKDKDKRQFGTSFLNASGYFEFKPNYRELVRPTYRGEQAIKDLEVIRAWEKKNQRDLAEFERLKRKFSASPPKEKANAER